MLIQDFLFFKYADPSDEPSSPPYDQSFEDYDLSVEQWKGNFKINCLASINTINNYELFVTHHI